ncbi:MAG: cupin domain-containing protein [Halioglobus sp.]|nr:cupin domain-containing protein [Halioglobus sp.]
MYAAGLNFDSNAFLAEYWQRKPLLIRNAINSFASPLPADELAGLALEEEVESRIIEYRRGQWRLQHGPFRTEDFKRDSPWTLLVQAVDHYVPAVAELRQLVDFLPSWRLDDVMVSYAVDGGSVGPHYDNYDVFLLQGEGERHWQLGQFCNSRSPLLPHDELRILANFACTEEHLLGPGDMLYVPPGMAHWGVARGECTTFSIGFRAPRINDMVSRWADSLLERLDPETFYTDGDMGPATRAGEIRPCDLERARAQVSAALDQAMDNHWFGAMVTEPRYDCGRDEDQLDHAMALLAGRPALLELSSAARVAWQQEESGIMVFCNGEAALFNDGVLGSLVALCAAGRVEGAALASGLAEAETARMMVYLLHAGGIDVE